MNSRIRILFCIFVTTIIIGCEARPCCVSETKVGAGVSTNWHTNAQFGYSNGENDPGINMDARAGGDWFAQAGLGLGAQLGRNGREGGSGIGIAGKAAGLSGGNLRGGFLGNWNNKRVKAAGDVGGTVGGTASGNTGAFWEKPGVSDP